MNEFAGRLARPLVSAHDALEREFEAGLAKWSSLAFRVAFSVLRQREDAEDVAQEALTKAYRSLRQLREHERLKAWIVRTAWRMALDRRESDIRRGRREQGVTDGPRVPTGEDMVLSAERAARLWTAIDTLPEKLRIVVVMASIQEHDLAQVAAALEIPEGTVKSRLFEARKLLRERLQ
jgi:RNA polymerase sigma-70 factor (ECF subfamily)